MSIRIKLVVDKSSLDDVETELNEILNINIKSALKEYQYESPNKIRLNNLIDLLIEKGFIERSDVI